MKLIIVVTELGNYYYSVSPTKSTGDQEQ